MAVYSEMIYILRRLIKTASYDGLKFPFRISSQKGRGLEAYVP